MARHDRILVSPTRAALVSEMLRAQTRANEEIAVLTPLDYFKWDAHLRPLADRREGRQQWSDTRHGEKARVAVAWWTDHVGRRHYRVVGGNSRDGSCKNLSATRKDGRPPLWHVYPERLFVRDVGKGVEWVAVCGCGECGPPERLGWMGRCCAACHDRAQEGDTPPMHVAIPTLGPHQGARRAVGFAPDGSSFATVRSTDDDGLSAVVRLDEIAADGWRTLPELNRGPTCLAFSPDGKQLAGTEGDFGGLFVFDLRSDERIFHHAPNLPIGCLAFSPDGLRLAAGGPQGVQVWRRASPDDEWKFAFGNDRPATSLAWSPKGDALAIAGAGQVGLVELLDGRFAARMTTPVDLTATDLAFTDDGRGLVCLCYAETRRWWAFAANFAAIVRHCRVDGDQADAFDVVIPSLRLGQLSSDGRTLAWVREDETMIRVRLAQGEAEMVCVGWDQDEQIVGLTFSPDGETVATVGEEGTVKIIPWRSLTA